MARAVWGATQAAPPQTWLNFLRCRPMERSESSISASRSALVRPFPGRRRLVLMDSVSHTLRVGMKISSCTALMPNQVCAAYLIAHA